jgi:hypothetical protein
MIELLQKMWSGVKGGMTSWHEAKMFIEHASVVSSDALHVLVGVLVWVLIAQLVRRSLAMPLPWLVLLALALLNECVDLWVEQWPSLAMQLGESAKDILLTMTLPTVMLFAVRLRPNLFRPLPSRRGR